MSVNKAYLNAAITIITELYALRRACLTGIMSYKEFREHLIANRDKIKETEDYTKIWPSPMWFEDLFHVRRKYTGESIDDVLACQGAYPEEDIWICEHAYDEFVFLMANKFLKKWDLKDKWTEEEKTKLKWIQYRILSEITHNSSTKSSKNNLLRGYGVTSFDDVPDYTGGVAKSEEEVKRDAEHVVRRKALEKFKREHLIVLTDHPAWRAVKITALKKVIAEDQEKHIKDSFLMYKHMIPDVTMEELGIEDENKG